MSTITVIAVLIFTVIGIVSAIISLFGKADKIKETEKEDVFVFPGSCEFTSKPCTPYEDLWHKARCPMRNQSSFRLAMMGLETGREDHAQREAIYKDEILHLINKSALCDKGEADSSVREFCLGQTPLNQSVEYRIKTAEIMRKYITTGKIPNKEEQLWTVCKKL